MWRMYSDRMKFQLTASQGGWRLWWWRVLSSTSISTHSLTRRLTPDPVQKKSNINISTHSLTRRLTAYIPCKDVANWNFNSQPHKEADSNFRQKHIYPKLIFLLITHISLIFYSNHHILNYFSCKIYVFPGANVLEYFCELIFRTIILRCL